MENVVVASSSKKLQLFKTFTLLNWEGRKALETKLLSESDLNAAGMLKKTHYFNMFTFLTCLNVCSFQPGTQAMIICWKMLTQK